MTEGQGSILASLRRDIEDLKDKVEDLIEHETTVAQSILLINNALSMYGRGEISKLELARHMGLLGKADAADEGRSG